MNHKEVANLISILIIIKIEMSERKSVIEVREKKLKGEHLAIPVKYWTICRKHATLKCLDIKHRDGKIIY